MSKYLTQEQYKNNIAILMSVIISGFKANNASEKDLKQVEEILTALATQSFEYGSLTADNERNKLS